MILKTNSDHHIVSILWCCVLVYIACDCPKGNLQEEYADREKFYPAKCNPLGECYCPGEQSYEKGKGCKELGEHFKQYIYYTFPFGHSSCGQDTRALTTRLFNMIKYACICTYVLFLIQGNSRISSLKLFYRFFVLFLLFVSLFPMICCSLISSVVFWCSPCETLSKEK